MTAEWDTDGSGRVKHQCPATCGVVEYMTLGKKRPCPTCGKKMEPVSKAPLEEEERSKPIRSLVSLGKPEPANRDKVYRNPPMSDYGKMTMGELLMEAAALLPTSFTLADLAVAAWRRWPDRFDLEGHPEHVDSHKVVGCLCGKRGLVGTGKLERLDGGRYMVATKKKES